MRAVYLSGGDAHSVAGAGLDALRDCALAARPQPVRISFQSLGRSVELPYQRAAQPLSLASAVDAARSALHRSGVRADDPRLGLFLGTSSGSIGEHELAFAREHAADPKQALAIRNPDQSLPTATVHGALGLRGPHYTLSTACSSAANAMLYAAWAIREGRLDRALVLGLEMENRLSQQGFFALMLAARDACKPFDLHREGIVLGEGIGAVVLSATRPDSGPVWRFMGGHSLCDTSHPTSPSDAMIAQTMRLACRDAGVEPQAITAIKTHGTGTRANDEAEGRALRQLFGAQLPPLTSLKPALGHTLGACGLLEALAFTACLDQGLVPPTAGFEQVDPALGLHPLQQAQAWHGGCVLLNTFGFGGNNCALVLHGEAS